MKRVLILGSLLLAFGSIADASTQTTCFDCKPLHLRVVIHPLNTASKPTANPPKAHR